VPKIPVKEKDENQIHFIFVSQVNTRSLKISPSFGLDLENLRGREILREILRESLGRFREAQKLFERIP